MRCPDGGQMRRREFITLFGGASGREPVKSCGKKPRRTHCGGAPWLAGRIVFSLVIQLAAILRLGPSVGGYIGRRR
jgi:hypothetical protein